MIVGNYNRENDLHIFCGLLFVCIMQLSTLFMPLGWLACLYCSLCVAYQKTTLSCTIVVVVALRLHRHKGNPIMHRKGCPEIASEVICTVEGKHSY